MLSVFWAPLLSFCAFSQIYTADADGVINVDQYANNQSSVVAMSCANAQILKITVLSFDVECELDRVWVFENNTQLFVSRTSNCQNDTIGAVVYTSGSTATLNFTSQSNYNGSYSVRWKCLSCGLLPYTRTVSIQSCALDTSQSCFWMYPSNSSLEFDSVDENSTFSLSGFGQLVWRLQSSWARANASYFPAIGPLCGSCVAHSLTNTSPGCFVVVNGSVTSASDSYACSFSPSIVSNTNNCGNNRSSSGPNSGGDVIWTHPSSNQGTSNATAVLAVGLLVIAIICSCFCLCIVGCCRSCMANRFSHPQAEDIPRTRTRVLLEESRPVARSIELRTIGAPPSLVTISAAIIAPATLTTTTTSSSSSSTTQNRISSSTSPETDSSQLPTPVAPVPASHHHHSLLHHRNSHCMPIAIATEISSLSLPAATGDSGGVSPP